MNINYKNKLKQLLKAAVYMMIRSYLIMLIWNYVMPDLLNFKEIEYIQVILIKIGVNLFNQKLN